MQCEKCFSSKIASPTVQVVSTTVENGVAKIKHNIVVRCFDCRHVRWSEIVEKNYAFNIQHASNCPTPRAIEIKHDNHASFSDTGDRVDVQFSVKFVCPSCQQEDERTEIQAFYSAVFA